MLTRRDELLIGLGVVVMGALTLWWLIPGYIATPRRVPIRALSPAFWPKIIGWTMLFCGFALTTRALMTPPPPEEMADTIAPTRTEALRMAGLAAILIGTYFALPVIGMVWTCMIVYALLILLTGGRNLGWGMIVAIVLPLVLYAFFTKVAGVAIPQGQFVRLP